MVCHEFKGGIGTASRVVDASAGGFTVGVLVQANYGRRDWLRVDGVPVGEAIPVDEVPSPYAAIDDDEPSPAPARRRPAPARSSSIVATDAPLLPHQCERLAQRPGSGSPGWAAPAATRAATCSSCFATGNRTCRRTSFRADPRVGARRPGARTTSSIGALFDATIEATEEAIVNALVAAPDDDRPRRDHRPRPAPRPSARDDGAGSGGRRSDRR